LGEDPAQRRDHHGHEVGRLCGKAETEPRWKEARRLQCLLPGLFQGEEQSVNGHNGVSTGKEEEEEEAPEAVGDLTVAFEENLFLSQEEDEEEEEEYDRPVTPPTQMASRGDEAPPSSQLESFVIEGRKEVLSVVSWNTHSLRFLNRPEQRSGMAPVLSRYDLVLLQDPLWREGKGVTGVLLLCHESNR